MEEEQNKKVLYIIGEIHNNKDDIEYRKMVENSAKNKNLIYLKEGKICGDFDKEEIVFSHHPNILGIEDLYIFTLANLCLARLLILKIGKDEYGYALYLYFTEQSKNLTGEAAEKCNILLKFFERDLDKYKVSYDKNYSTITSYIKQIARHIYLEISCVQDNPIKGLFEKINFGKELIDHYIREGLFSKMQNAITVENSLYDTDVKIDDVVIYNFLKDKEEWEKLIKLLMFGIVKKITESGHYINYEKYLNEKFIDDLFKIPNLQVRDLYPIILSLRNKSYLLNIKSLLENKCASDEGIPIYAIMDDKHIPELKGWLGGRYKEISIIYHPLDGRANRPQPEVVQKHSLTEIKKLKLKQAELIQFFNSKIINSDHTKSYKQQTTITAEFSEKDLKKIHEELPDCKMQ